MPDLINSVEEILQGDFALLRSIAAGQKELLSLGRTILAELRKAPAIASDGTQRHNTLQGVSGGEVAGDVQKAGGPTHEEEYSVREWGVASAEAGDIPLVHADRGMDEEEHSGGDHKKGKDQRQRHDEDDDGDYVPSSSEVILLIYLHEMSTNTRIYGSNLPGRAIGDIRIAAKKSRVTPPTRKIGRRSVSTRGR